MAALRGVRVALGVALLTSVLALTWARPATGRTPSGWAGAVSAAASEEGGEEPVPVATAPRRLAVEHEEDSGPGPALWVGAVLGVSGLAGLAFSLLNRRGDRQA